MKNALSALLTEMANDYERLEEEITWTAQNLNLTVYTFDDVEKLQKAIKSNTDGKIKLSTKDIQQLESGNTVITKIRANYLNLNLLLFIHPVIRNGEIQSLLFLHLPVNNMGEEYVFTKMTIFVTLLAAGITILFAKKTFGKASDQLQDIRAAAIEVTNGNFNTKLWKNSKDEIGEISEAFNMMTESLKTKHIQIREFIEDITHEIKAPLALVKSYNQALMDKVINGEENQQKCYELIDRETDRLNKLIQNYLDFAKLGADSVKLNLQPIVFAQNVEDIMMKYKLLFHERNIDLHMKLDYDIIISADEDRLEQIIQNIVRNAIRYSTEEPRIDITLKKKETTCVLTISDNGVGISDEDLAIITNRFFRVNKVRSSKESGTGLGLSIVEKLMELHGGNIIIESQLGVGTTVNLEFPLFKTEG